MHDEVSETESIRKNLSIERMIVEGCEILLDVQQTFVRQGKSKVPPLSGKVRAKFHLPSPFTLDKFPRKFPGKFG